MTANRKIQRSNRNSNYSPGRTTKQCLPTAALNNESYGMTHAKCALIGTHSDSATTIVTTRQATCHLPMSHQTQKQPTYSILLWFVRTTDVLGWSLAVSNTLSHRGPTYRCPPC